MNATEVQYAIPETEAPDAIPEIADHQLQLTVQQVRRMINYLIIS